MPEQTWVRGTFRPPVKREPESGAHPVASAPEQNTVSRVELEVAQGEALNELVQRIGLQRMVISRGAMPDGFYIDRANRIFVECDVPLRNRAIAYAEEWGLLKEERVVVDTAGGVISTAGQVIGTAMHSAGRFEPVSVRVGGTGARPSPPFFTACVAGNRPALILREDGSIEVFGERVAGEWKGLIEQLDAIQATEWDIKTRRTEDAIVIADRLLLGDDGRMDRVVVFGGKLEVIANLDADEAAGAFAAAVRDAYRARRAQIVARALFESDREVFLFVRRVADARLPGSMQHHEILGDITTYEIKPERMSAAYDKAWARDEHGWRSAALTRAETMLYHLEDL